MAQLNMAIRWSDEPAKLTALRHYRGVPVHGRPLHIDKGSQVAIVQPNGNVSRFFECASVEGPMPVTLANGDKKENGFIVRAKPGTDREPSAGMQIKAKWRAVGRFLYFDDNWKRVDVTGHRGDGKYLADGVHEDIVNIGAEKLPFRPYTGGIPGKDRKDPEAVLVDQYIQWVGIPRQWVSIISLLSAYSATCLIGAAAGGSLKPKLRRTEKLSGRRLDNCWTIADSSGGPRVWASSFRDGLEIQILLF